MTAEHKLQTTTQPRVLAATAALAIALGLLLGWLGDALKGELVFCAWTGWTESHCRSAGLHIWIAALSLLGIIALLTVGQRLLQRVGIVEGLHEVPPVAAAGMVALVSRPNHQRLECHDGLLTVHFFAQSQPPWSIACPCADLTGTLQRHAGSWNWLPLLMAVAAQQSHLRHLTLIASPESAADLADCVLVLRRLLGDAAPEVRLCTHRPDFYSLDEVRAAIRSELARLRACGGAVVVDITGGTKTASIAGAVGALDEGAVLGYVEGRRVRHYRLQATRWHAW